MDKIIIDLSDIHYRQGWEVHVKKRLLLYRKTHFTSTMFNILFANSNAIVTLQKLR